MSKLRFAPTAVFVFAFCAATAIVCPAQNLTTLFSFNAVDGTNPQSVTQGTDGNFYGVTYSGGANSNAGTIFKITPTGTLTTLHNFCSEANCTDGENPAGKLLQASDGNFYGTTYLGGSCPEFNPAGCGTIFKITSEGQFTSLYSFCSVVVNGLCADGENPNAGLIQGTGGYLYGTTVYGGDNAADNNCFCSGSGTAFKISTAGDLTTIYQFCNSTNQGGYCLDGDTPFGGLVQTSDGTLYGTLYNGGVSPDNSGGTIYKLTSSGTLTTLHNFCSKPSCTDGAYPFTSLIRASNGNFYGVTRNGGDGGDIGYGTVFEITPSGKFSTLHRFDGTDGVSPYGELLQANDGNLYGTTSEGGPHSNTGISAGTLFKMSLAGHLSVLHVFCSESKCSDGSNPAAGVVQGKDGNLYGTTGAGGANSDGLIFRWTLHE